MNGEVAKKLGDVRRSQVLHSAGVGAVIDLPSISAMVLGLHRWEAPVADNVVREDRLLAIVRQRLGTQVDKLCLPPIPRGDGRDPFDPANARGVPVAPFPNWLRCPRCELLARRDSGHFRLEHNAYRPDRSRYVHTNCHRGKGTAIPARFALACEAGHLDDFPWRTFLGCTGGEACGNLRFQERGVSAEVADLMIECQGCNKKRLMVDAFGDDRQLPPCSGRHPHLGGDPQARCDVRPRTMLIGASNLWFAVSATALSLPTRTGRLESLIEKHWAVLEKATSREILGAFRAVGQIGAFQAWSDDELWDAMQRRQRAHDEEPERVDLKVAEWAAFSQPGEPGADDDFRLRAVPPPPAFGDQIAEVVLVEKLRVVKALTAFTRIQSPGDFAEDEMIPEDILVPLTRGEPTWVPAAEVRGEGIFVRLREDALARHLAKKELRELDRAFLRAHVAFRAARKMPDPHAGYPGLRYVLLHTLSHLLIRQLAIECGYAAASVAERIYSRDGGEDGPMAGILLYTAAADSEGTLGGLVSLGEPREFERHLAEALRRATLCSSDPLCAEHPPIADARTLHAGACHACSFASETSCERGNKYLDRNLLVATMAERLPPFFRNDQYEA